MFSDPIFLSRKLRTKRAVTNYIGASSDGQRRDKMIKQTTKSNNWTHSSESHFWLQPIGIWAWLSSYLIWHFAELDLIADQIYLKGFSNLFLNISWALITVQSKKNWEQRKKEENIWNPQTRPQKYIAIKNNSFWMKRNIFRW